MLFSEDQLERYARHFVLKEIGPSGQKRLLQAKVLVIGAGALGSASLLYLAAAGVGTLGIADFDEVDMSNLQRQIIHRMDTVGQLKTLSAKRAIEERNPDVNVQLHQERMTPDNIQPIIEQYDFIIDATDRFESKFLVNDACVLSQKPYCHAGVLRFEGQVMTYVPGQGPCFRCLLEEVPTGEEAGYTCAQLGVLGAATGIIGSLEALEAIKYLLGIGTLLTGRILCFDGLDMQIDIVEAPAVNPACRVCGEHADITSLADNRSDYEITDCAVPGAQDGTEAGAGSGAQDGTEAGSDSSAGADEKAGAKAGIEAGTGPDADEK